MKKEYFTFFNGMHIERDLERWPENNGWDPELIDKDGYVRYVSEAELQELKEWGIISIDINNVNNNSIERIVYIVSKKLINKGYSSSEIIKVIEE